MDDANTTPKPFDGPERLREQVRLCENSLLRVKASDVRQTLEQLDAAKAELQRLRDELAPLLTKEGIPS